MPSIVDANTYDLPEERRNGSTIKPILRLVSLIEYRLPPMFPIGPISTLAYSLALKRLEALGNILPDYKLEIELIDSEVRLGVEIYSLFNFTFQCNDSTVIPAFVRSMERISSGINRVPLFGLNECGMDATRLSAMMIRHYNMIGLSAFPQHLDLFNKKSRYPNYFSLAERADQLCIGLAKFIQTLGWQRISMVSVHDNYQTMVTPDMVLMIIENDFQIFSWKRSSLNASNL